MTICQGIFLFIWYWRCSFTPFWKAQMFPLKRFPRGFWPMVSKVLILHFTVIYIVCPICVRVEPQNGNLPKRQLRVRQNGNSAVLSWLEATKMATNCRSVQAGSDRNGNCRNGNKKSVRMLGTKGQSEGIQVPNPLSTSSPPSGHLPTHDVIGFGNGCSHSGSCRFDQEGVWQNGYTTISEY